MNGKNKEQDIVNSFIEEIKKAINKLDKLDRKNENVVALIEAKYRSNMDRPTTDALIASFWKMLWEWKEKYCFSFQIKLIFIIFVKKGLERDITTFRNGIFNKFRYFGRKFCNREIPLHVFTVIVEDRDSGGVEFNNKDIQKFLEFIKNI